jgi:hypothetical protein
MKWHKFNFQENSQFQHVLKLAISVKSACSSQCHLPRQQTRQQQVARPAEVLDLEQECRQFSEHRRDEPLEIPGQRIRRKGNLDIVHDFLVDVLLCATARVLDDSLDALADSEVNPFRPKPNG